jgi:cytochrome d ubiquinol oxidase subunit II
MAPTPLTLAVAAIMFVAVTAYALFAGADFGGGIWDMLAGGTRQGAEPRAQIDESITPVWEANHVWLVLMLVVLWSAFPPGFAAIMTALFIPLNLSLLGIFFRGVGFAFRHTARTARLQQVDGAMFAASSVMTPFFLGTVVGAITTGAVRPGNSGNNLSAWTSATALLTGALAVAACAYIAAVYLVRDASRRNRPHLARYFAIRAAIAGTLSGVLAVTNLAVMQVQAPYVFHGLVHRALPLMITSVIAGAGALALIGLLLSGLHRVVPLLPVAAALTVATAVWGWAVAQYPYLLPGTLTLRQAAAPSGTMVTEIVTAAMIVTLVVPGFVSLYWLQQHGLLTESDSSADLRTAVAAQNHVHNHVVHNHVRGTSQSPAASGRELVSGLAVGAVVGAALIDLARRPFTRRRHLQRADADDHPR